MIGMPDESGKLQIVTVGEVLFTCVFGVDISLMAHMSITSGPLTNSRGEKWFGVQIVECLGLHMLVHIMNIEADGVFTLSGLNVLLRIG